MLPTVNVRCTVYDQSGNPTEGNSVTAKLSAMEINSGYVFPEQVSAVTDALGVATLSLWPNELGAVASHYTFQISNPDTGRTELITATIPNTNCELHLVANTPAYAGKTDGQLLIEEAISIILPAAASISANSQVATEQAVIATDKAAEGSASAAAAKVSEDAALEAQLLNVASVQEAVTAANIAVSNADIAVLAQDAATDKAGEASVSAVIATTGADTATTMANGAAVSAAAALVSKDAAGVSATTASTGATTATTQAGIATTKATEATDAADIAVTAAATAVASDPSGHVVNTNNPHGTTKAQVGLGNVDNTTDVGKPVSTAQATALGLKLDANQKDASGGIPGLTLFKLNLKNVAGTITSWFTNAATAARTWTLPDKDGTVAMLSDITGTNSGTNTGDETLATIKTKLGIATLSGSNTGDQVLPTLASLGLSNVTNTTDANKPVSTAQQTALNLKANLASPTFTGTVGGITAAMVGLGSVNNTSDAAKPVSTAQAAAIALKQDADVNTAKLNVSQSWPAQQVFKEVKDTVYTIIDGAAFEIDPVNGAIQTVILGASRSPAATNFEAGQIVLLGVDDGTAYTITWPSVTWVKSGGAASAPTLATTGYTWVMLWKVGSTLYGVETGKP